MTQPNWVVELTIATPKPVTEELLDVLDEEGDGRDWYITPRPEGPGVRVAVYETAPSPVEVATQVSSAVTKWLAEHGVHGDTIELRILTEDQREAEAQAPTMPTLVSATGAAEILGVQRQRVHQLYKNNSRFPAPLVQLATGPVWDEKAIEWFNSIWERKAGRPTKSAATEAKRGRPDSNLVDMRARKVPKLPIKKVGRSQIAARATRASTRSQHK